MATANRQVVVLALIITATLACFISDTSPSRVAALNGPILANAINDVITKINWNYADSWTALWGTIFCQRNISALDDAIAQNIARGDLLDALFVARLAELNQYYSSVIASETERALQQMPMAGSVPVTSTAQSYGQPGEGAFTLYYRYLIYCYLYAQQWDLTEKWNVTQAYIDFESAYVAPPSDSVSGEMLWINPAKNTSASYTSRYYDEHAETMDIFVKFCQIGIQEALAYADDAWENVQAHWNGQYYGYTSDTLVECEMGNFAEIIAGYMQQKGAIIPYWDRVIADLDYKLLAEGWASPGWAQPGVIIHATGYSQLRLLETLSAIIALHQLYPYFTEQMKTAFANMLMGAEPAWQGLIKSPLNMGNGSYIAATGYTPSIEASICAAATLFLEGIIPVTGSLAIPFREEQYGDYRSPFQVANFQFDYDHHLIIIPIKAGTLSFIYGLSPVNYTFQTDGTYMIQFSSDWQSILNVKNLNAPADLTIRMDGKPKLTWSKPINDSAVQEYRIFRGFSPESKTFLAVTNKLVFIDDTAENGNVYFYQIACVEGSSMLLFSNEVKATVDYAPVVHAKYDNKWHVSDFLVHLSITDDKAPSICYRLNDGPIKTVSKDGYPLIVTESALNFLEYWSISPLESKESPHEFLMRIKLDKTPPNLALTVKTEDTPAPMSSVTLNLTASDNVSGLFAMRFSDNNSTWSDWEPYSAKKQLTVQNMNGTLQIYAQVSDNAGLISTLKTIINLNSTVPIQTLPQSVITPAVPELRYTASFLVAAMTLMILAIIRITAKRMH